MNYLAHLFLSCSDDSLLMGNLVADWISNKDILDMDPAMKIGIDLHRSIDRFTDNHAVIRQGSRRLQPKYSKYSPVIIDVFYDHLLFNNWKKYTSQEFEAFKLSVYKVIRDQFKLFPEYIQKRLLSMADHDWLENYTSIERMHYVFKRLKERTKFPSTLEEAAGDLERDYLSYEEEFNIFFPDVIAHVDSLCKCD